MVPVTIQCGCGQRYAFDVEPVDGRMPSAVTCPSCGADGTGAANAALAQGTAPALAAEATPGPTLRVGASQRSHQPGATEASGRAPARPMVTQLPGQVSRTQAKIEARAKILWGDPPRAVLVYLMSQGFDHEAASALVEELSQERASAIRGKGIMYLFGGIALVCVPIGALLIFLGLGYILVKTFLVTILVGFWGVWMVFKGAGMLMAPKSAPGDIAEH
jgi:hypothetical protein